MDQIGVTQAFFLALIQGITEFLPVSSSGNLILFQEWFGVTGEQLTFTVIVHVASASAIVFFFLDRLQRLARQLWLPVLIGTLPAVLVALFFKDAIEAMFANSQQVSFALFITGLINLGIQYILNKRNKSRELLPLDPKKPEESVESPEKYSVGVLQSLVIGSAQAMAITPGISRSGSTVFAGLLTGLSRKNAFEFSFLLAIPAIAGATLLQIVGELNSASFGVAEFVSLPYFVGFVGSFAASYGSLWLLRFMMERAQFWWFSVYCFGLGIAGLLFT